MVLKQVLAVSLMATMGVLAGCDKDPVKMISAQIVNDMDKGSGNFDRVLKICFKKPITSDYYHKVTIITEEAYKLEGAATLRPMASDPSNRCQYRNIYSYINRDSGPNARQMVQDYILPGHINQLLIQIYDEKPVGKELPIDERLFKGL